MSSKELKSRIKRKHVALTIRNKLKVQNNLKMVFLKKNIAEEFGIGQQTVRYYKAEGIYKDICFKIRCGYC
jgi:hypothetical protein